MPMFPDKVINAYKSVVDAAGLINQADNLFYVNFNPQHECLFEMLIYPEDLLSSLSLSAINLKPSILLDPLISRYYLYDIDIPIVGFEYERYNGKREISNIVYPDQVTCTFLESASGTVKGYLRRWLADICKYNAATKEYSFNDDQVGSKRKALIYPYARDMIPSLEYIEITGLKIETIDPLHFGHDSGEIQKIKVNFSCDNAQIVNVGLF